MPVLYLTLLSSPDNSCVIVDLSTRVLCFVVLIDSRYPHYSRNSRESTDS